MFVVVVLLFIDTVIIWCHYKYYYHHRGCSVIIAIIPIINIIIIISSSSSSCNIIITFITITAYITIIISSLSSLLLGLLLLQRIYIHYQFQVSAWGKDKYTRVKHKSSINYLCVYILPYSLTGKLMIYLGYLTVYIFTVVTLAPISFYTWPHYINSVWGTDKTK